MVEARARCLFPQAEETIDPRRFYDGEDRWVPDDRPYVVINMVASIDGATAIGGVTEPLGSATDRSIFLHLRDVADAILVGASTVRAESYGPARPSVATQDVRVGRGQPPRPPIVVVSRSLSFDWDLPLFSNADPRPILVVPADTDGHSQERARRAADVVAVGSGSVDMSGAMEHLRSRGIETLLCEGGPILNAGLLAAGLVDEVCLTIAPLLAGGDSPKGLFGATPSLVALPLVLVHVLEDDGVLFVRYRRET